MTIYRTILIYAGPPLDAGVARVAAHLAREFDARLVGVACSDIALLLAPGWVETGSETIAQHLMERIEAADSALEALRAVARDVGVAAVRTHRLNGRAEKELAVQMRFADLAVVGQGADRRLVRDGWRTLPELLLRDAARAVVVVPDGFVGANCGERVVIAWDGSAAAARAVFAALPMLQRARVVEAVRYATEDGFNLPGELESLADYLALHGVRVRMSFLRARRNVDIGAALLAHAQSCDADLLVLGDYGHTRLRELMLGSVSATVMRRLSIPALFSH